jgi:electron transport complex protein RnfG
MDTEPSEKFASMRLLVPVVSLALLAALGAALIAATDQLTRKRVAENEAAQIMKVLDALLPEGGYDNSPHLDVISLTGPELPASNATLPVYRARRAGAPVTAILTVIAPDGYVGSIRLLVGIRADGTISGVRALEHRETPGLGDNIELGRSDWIRLFDGRSIEDPAPAAWLTRRDGGDFDQISGATVTSRAVIAAVRDSLIYFAENRDLLFSEPVDPEVR